MKERILYCRCAYAQVVPGDVKDAVLEGLSASGAAFDAVPDLCEMAARKDPALRALAGAEGDAPTIVACFPRAVKWLFHQTGAPLPEGTRILNMREGEAQALVEEAVQ